MSDKASEETSIEMYKDRYNKMREALVKIRIETDPDIMDDITHCELRVNRIATEALSLLPALD